MSFLSDKNIVLGVSGGIAAYKSADLVRKLKQAGARVQVVMTESAKRFVTPLTFQALSGMAVTDSLWNPQQKASMGHIELARWADMLLIAPATANTIAHLAGGHAQDLLTTLCLTTEAPIAIAPAMNLQMWRNQLVQANVSTLRQQNWSIWGPASGSQACGEIGEGRMWEPTQLVQAISDLFQAAAPQNILTGLNLVITAGPTREAIDPVRYISNHSSGKMGFCCAQAAANFGAQVTLISGPVNLEDPKGAQRIDVETALEMSAAVKRHLSECDIFIACAAVSDYRPKLVSNKKIKKSDQALQLLLQPNIDILAHVSTGSNRPFCVGFAAETDKLKHYARQKLINKGLDMIAANWVGGPDTGFNHDSNALLILWQGGEQQLTLSSKAEQAKQLMQLIAKGFYAKNSVSDS